MGDNPESPLGLNQTFSALSKIVDLTIVPWGNAEVDADGTWDCQHGPLECTGNTIESCIIHLHPSQDQWFPFVLAFEGAQESCGRGNQSATNNPVACAKRIAEAQGLPWDPVQQCFQSFDKKTGMPPKSSLGYQLQMQAKATTDALLPAHTGVPTVTVGADGPPVSSLAMSNIICYACNAYKGSDKPVACATCSPLAALPSSGKGCHSKDAQAVSLFGDLLCKPELSADDATSCLTHLQQARQEFADDVLPTMCSAAASACIAIGTNFSACADKICCNMLPDPKAPYPGYSCQLNTIPPHSASKGISLGRRLACDWSFRESVNAVGRFMMPGSFVGGHLDNAHGLFVLGHHQISMRTFGMAEMTLGIAANQANATISKDMPLTEYAPNAKDIPTESLLGNIYYHFALTEYLLGSHAQQPQPPSPHTENPGLDAAILNWETAIRYSTGPSNVLPTDDQLISTINWLFQAYMRANRSNDAARTLDLLSGKSLRVIEETEYLSLVQFYNGTKSLATITKQMEDAESTDPETFCTLAYAVANHHYYSGKRAEAVELWKRVVATPTWAAFGYIAAEVELFRAQAGMI